MFYTIEQLVLRIDFIFLFLAFSSIILIAVRFDPTILIVRSNVVLNTKSIVSCLICYTKVVYLLLLQFRVYVSKFSKLSKPFNFSFATCFALNRFVSFCGYISVKGSWIFIWLSISIWLIVSWSCAIICSNLSSIYSLCGSLFSCWVFIMVSILSFICCIWFSSNLLISYILLAISSNYLW